MNSNNNLEVEVKFFVPDLAAVREAILAAGGHLEKPRVHEFNISYDNPWSGLQRKAMLLRLRQDKIARLTFKGTPEEAFHSEAKIREELEVEVSDFETTAVILERIGFEQVRTYEKYRETFLLGELEIVLDELPFGNFVEIEGGQEHEQAIRETAVRLHLDWNRRILDNYLSLMAQMKAHHDLPFDNLTFENFAELGISVADLFEVATE
jgi:adenylate cyclase class 2